VSLDSVVRTFDIPTGRLIDAFRTPSVATSLSFSPTNDFLATSHVDSVGVFLWANRAQYTEVSFQTVSDKDIADVGLPTMQEDLDEDGWFILPFFLPAVQYQTDSFLAAFFMLNIGVDR
jgi:U3 small nucleolar RNA-associated protein 21